jgi:hypothetical protein
MNKNFEKKIKKTRQQMGKPEISETSKEKSISELVRDDLEKNNVKVVSKNNVNNLSRRGLMGKISVTDDRHAFANAISDAIRYSLGIINANEVVNLNITSLFSETEETVNMSCFF